MITKPHILVAVDVRSTHNVGAFFRSCDGLGMDLYLVGICPRPIHDDDNRLPYIANKSHKAIAKTALGAEKTVHWRYADTLLECVSILRKEGYVIVALEQDNRSKPLSKIPKDRPIALVVGREVEGLDLVELKLCDEIVEIPMNGSKESLNVSVAAGIGMYELTRNCD